MPTCSSVTDETFRLKRERDKAKKRFIIDNTHHSRVKIFKHASQWVQQSQWTKKAHQANGRSICGRLERESTWQHYTWNFWILKKTRWVEVKKIDGLAPSCEKRTPGVVEPVLQYSSKQRKWNNINLPSPADQVLPICQDHQTLKKTRLAIKGMKRNCASGVDYMLSHQF